MGAELPPQGAHLDVGGSHPFPQDAAAQLGDSQDLGQVIPPLHVSDRPDRLLPVPGVLEFVDHVGPEGVAVGDAEGPGVPPFHEARVGKRVAAAFGRDVVVAVVGDGQRVGIADGVVEGVLLPVVVGRIVGNVAEVIEQRPRWSIVGQRQNAGVVQDSSGNGADHALRHNVSREGLLNPVDHVVGVGGTGHGGVGIGGAGKHAVGVGNEFVEVAGPHGGGGHNPARIEHRVLPGGRLIEKVEEGLVAAVVNLGDPDGAAGLVRPSLGRLGRRPGT